MKEPAPIVGTIAVQQIGPSGVAATVNGQPQRFSTLDAVFAAAIHLLDEPPERDVRRVQLELIPH